MKTPNNDPWTFNLPFAIAALILLLAFLVALYMGSVQQ